MKRLVLYHANCPDGFGAALAAWLHYGEDAEYLPVQYGQDPPDVTLRDVDILDFSYKRPVLLKMYQEARHLRVLDHHATAQEDLDGLDFCKFDMSKSGCVLAWEEYFGRTSMPNLFLFLQDRDLWRWELEGSREISAGIASYPKAFDIWDKWTDEDQEQLALARLQMEGGAILRYQAQVVESHVKAAKPLTLDGHEVLSVNATVLQSEIGHELGKDKPFSVTWMERDGKRIYSLRSAEDGVDVSQLAKAHGGGGHKHAAGFTE